MTYITLWRSIFKLKKYIQKVTNLNSVGFLACHTDQHYTLFLVPLWLGKRDEIYPILQPLGIPIVCVTCTKST